MMFAATALQNLCNLIKMPTRSHWQSVSYNDDIYYDNCIVIFFFFDYLGSPTKQKAKQDRGRSQDREGTRQNQQLDWVFIHTTTVVGPFMRMVTAGVEKMTESVKKTLKRMNIGDKKTDTVVKDGDKKKDKGETDTDSNQQLDGDQPVADDVLPESVSYDPDVNDPEDLFEMMREIEEDRMKPEVVYSFFERLLGKECNPKSKTILRAKAELYNYLFLSTIELLPGSELNEILREF